MTASLYLPHLEKERLRYEDEGRIDQFEAYKTLVRDDWANGRIVAGQNYPECDGTVALLVESYYCFATR